MFHTNKGERMSAQEIDGNFKFKNGGTGNNYEFFDIADMLIKVDNNTGDAFVCNVKNREKVFTKITD